MRQISLYYAFLVVVNLHYIFVLLPLTKKYFGTNPVGKSSYIIIMIELDLNLPFMENAGEQFVRTCIKTFGGDF